jgi:hypothetical protein
MMIPPIGAHEFNLRFYHGLHEPWFGSRLPVLPMRNFNDDGELLHRIPKKLSYLDENSDGRETFWGLYARESVSFSWVWFYQIISLVPCFAYLASSLWKGFEIPLDGSMAVYLCLFMQSLFWATAQLG